MRCSGVLAGVPGGPAPGGQARGLPALPARSGRRGSGVNGGRRPSQGDARQRTVDAGGAAADPGGLPGTAHRGRRPGRVGAVHRGGVVAFATARLIFACRIRRSAVRRTVPRTYGESRLAQNIHGDHSCRGMRPGTPPACEGRGCCPGAGEGVSWSSPPIRSRPARGRPPPRRRRAACRGRSSWRTWRAAAAAPSRTGPASPAGGRPAGA